MRDLLPLLKLLGGPLLRTLLLGLLLSGLAGITAISLLGLSGWFITMSALVGLGSTPVVGQAITSFSYLFPSGGVRALALLRTLGRYGERTVNHQVTFLFLARLRVECFDKALLLPLRTLWSFRSGDLLERVMADIDLLDQMLLRVLVPTISALIVVSVMIVFLAFQSAFFSALIVIMLLVTGLGLPILMAWLGRRPGTSFVEARAAARTLCIEALQGREEIASYHAEERAKQQVARSLAAADQAQHAQRLLCALGSGLTTFLASTTMQGALLIGLWSVGQGKMSGPLVVMACLITLGLFESIEALPLAYQFLGQARRAAQRLNALLLPEKTASPYRHQISSPAMIRQGPTTSGSALTTPANSAISLQHVHFCYDQTRGNIFEELTCTIPAGSFVAITGPSGSGKSTLLRLLAGELEPTQGVISVEEPATREIGLDSLILQKKYRMFVAQESHIFHTTLRENLLMAKPDATEQELQHALDVVCLTDLVKRLEQGLDTQLGEHGEALSGGERRRLIIARALLISPRILLLDEPVAGIDSPIARQMLLNIRQELAKSTIVVTTHDSWLVAMAELQLQLSTHNLSAF